MDPKRRYWFIKVGYNYRMTNVQAALGLAQLEKINWHMGMRKKVAELYYDNLKPLSQFIELPIEKEWAHHSFWMFSILLKNSVKISRDRFMKLLSMEGIETRPVFYPVTDMPPYKNISEKFPIAKKIAARGINIPTHAGLTKQDIQYITKIIKKYCFKFSK
jgi:perosamine synthetase